MPEFDLFGFLIPWWLILGLVSYLIALAVVNVLERRGLARHIWNLPLFFFALFAFTFSLLGLILFS